MLRPARARACRMGKRETREAGEGGRGGGDSGDGHGYDRYGGRERGRKEIWAGGEEEQILRGTKTALSVSDS